MTSTTSFELGDVVLVTYPFTSQAGAKQRPAVVVSSALYDRKRLDVVLMPVTSQVRPVAGFGEVLVTDWQAAGLVVPGLIKPILFTIEKALVVKRFGQLQARDRAALQAALRQVLGL